MQSNLNKIQTFQNTTLRKITNAFSCITNFTFHTYLKIKIVHNEANTFFLKLSF